MVVEHSRQIDWSREKIVSLLSTEGPAPLAAFLEHIPTPLTFSSYGARPGRTKASVLRLKPRRL